MSKVQFDENMIIPESLGRPDVRFYDADEEPIRIYGIFRDGESYYRLPSTVAEKVSPGIHDMCSTTAGGRVRFLTDSPYVAVAVKYGFCEKSVIIPEQNMMGLDIYADDSFVGAFRPPVDFNGETVYSSIDIPLVLQSEAEEQSTFKERKMRLITINLPSYSSIKNLKIGIAKKAKISHAPDYKHEKPVVFYGSSITNGAAASRPGMTYEARLSRMLDMNFVNLGFGGLCKGEPAMAEYISGLDMSVFVMDYDHNAKTVEYLESTHEPFFTAVRDKKPDLPIVIISRPNYCPDCAERFAVIRRTYENALSRGDKNVYLINGMEFFGGELDFTVDKIHPTDIGFYFMAEKIAKVLKPLLG